jgi:hypothetical protein
MSHVQLRNEASWPGDAEAGTDDYRPARVRATDRLIPSPAMSEMEAPNERRKELLCAGGTVNLRKLEERLSRKPLIEIAILINGLTYGEMIELAEAMWKSQPEGLTITQDNLPALLHRWCKSVAEGAGCL